MSEILTTKIDGVEFVTYKDYLNLEQENKNLNIIIENTKKEQKADRKHIEELEGENKKLKERINELEATNKKRTADNWATFKS